MYQDQIRVLTTLSCVIIIVVIAIVTVYNPNPSPFMFLVIKTILALSVTTLFIMYESWFIQTSVGVVKLIVACILFIVIYLK